MDARAEYDLIIESLQHGTPSDWCYLTEIYPHFPNGTDRWLERHWITHTVHLPTVKREALVWLLDQKVDLAFVDAEGFGILHSTLDRSADDRYEILRLLLQHGAPVNLNTYGNGTPAHLAVARGDLKALKLFIEFHADLNICRLIDGCTTPLEEAIDMLHSLEEQIQNQQTTIMFLQQRESNK